MPNSKAPPMELRRLPATNATCARTKNLSFPCCLVCLPNHNLAANRRHFQQASDSLGALATEFLFRRVPVLPMPLSSLCFSCLAFFWSLIRRILATGLFSSGNCCGINTCVPDLFRVVLLHNRRVNSIRIFSSANTLDARENIASDATSPRYSYPQSLRKLGFVFKFSISTFVVERSYTTFRKK